MTDNRVTSIRDQVKLFYCFWQPSSRHYLNNDDCLENTNAYYRTVCAVLCSIVVRSDMRIHRKFLQVTWLRFRFSFLYVFAVLTGIIFYVASGVVRSIKISCLSVCLCARSCVSLKPHVQKSWIFLYMSPVELRTTSCFPIMRNISHLRLSGVKSAILDCLLCLILVFIFYVFFVYLFVFYWLLLWVWLSVSAYTI